MLTVLFTYTLSQQHGVGVWAAGYDKSLDLTSVVSDNR